MGVSRYIYDHYIYYLRVWIQIRTTDRPHTYTHTYCIRYSNRIRFEVDVVKPRPKYLPRKNHLKGIKEQIKEKSNGRTIILPNVQAGHKEVATPKCW